MEDLSEYVEEVSDYNLSRSPFCNVGMIIGINKDNKRPYGSTAFYIGNKKVITVANFFDKVMPNKFVFIPAMRDGRDFFGKLFGFYKIIEYKVHPRYVPGHISNDICCAKIGEGKKNVAGTEESPVFEHIDIDNILNPLPIQKYEPGMSREWIVLGYGGMADISSIRMLKMTAREDHSDEVQRNVSTNSLRVMSGGPWIKKEDWGAPRATGITVNREGRTLYSPIIGEDDLHVLLS